MDTLGAYGSDDSDSDSASLSAGNAQASAKFPMIAVTAPLGAATTHASSEPVHKRPRPASSILPSPTIDSNAVGSSMVLWPEDYLTAKLKEAESAPRDKLSTAANALTSSLAIQLARNPKDWLETLSRDPDFTNPHQFEAVANGLGIRCSLFPLDPLKDWERVDRLQELDRDALIKVQHQY